jgi:hypothetical protein
MQDVAFDRDVCVNGNRSVTAYWRSDSRYVLVTVHCRSRLAISAALHATCSNSSILCVAVAHELRLRCFDKQRLPSRYFEPCEDLIVDRQVV